MALVWLAGCADDAPPPAPPAAPASMVAPTASPQPAAPAHLDEPQFWRDLSGRPRGTEWDDERQDELVARYPALAARFR